MLRTFSSHLFRIWLKWSLNLVKTEKHKILGAHEKEEKNPVRFLVCEINTGNCGQLRILKLPRPSEISEKNVRA